MLNVTGATLDLTGCHFDEEVIQGVNQGINYTFTSGVLQVPEGGRIIVARDRAAFLAAYPAASPVADNGFNPSRLDNGGESLVLYAASGLEIFRTTYSDSIASTDGGGRTLVRVLSTTNPNVSTSVWRESTVDGGNPGTTDAVAFAGAPLADVDLDGLAALLEYGLGTADNVPSAPSLTLTRDAQGIWFFTFPVAPSNR